MNDVVLMYIIISLIWLIVLIISSMIFGSSLYSALVSILFLVIYIPVAYYYISQGETYKLRESLFIAIILLIVYVIAEAAYAIAFLRDRLMPIVIR